MSHYMDEGVDVTLYILYRFLECEEFTQENVRSLNMTVAVMFRYIWYGTFRKESERLNRLLSSLLIVIQTQIAYIYVTRAYNA